MKRNTGLIVIGLIDAVLLLLISLGLFYLEFSRTTEFWFSYSSIIGAILFNFLAYVISSSGQSDDLLIFGLSLKSLSWSFMTMGLVAGFLTIFFSSTLGSELVIGASAVLIGLDLLTLIVALVYGKRQRYSMTRVRKSFAQAEIEEITRLIRSCHHNGLRNELVKLLSTMRLSNTEAHPGLSDIEGRILLVLNDLILYCESNRVKDAVSACREVDILIKERTRVLNKLN